MTLRRIMHMVDPETEDWTFRLNTQPSHDAEIFRHFTWGPSNTNSRRLVTVIVQPPWILSPRDLDLFVKCQGVSCLTHDLLLSLTYHQIPTYDTENPDPLKYRAKERLWANVSQSLL